MTCHLSHVFFSGVDDGFCGRPHARLDMVGLKIDLRHGCGRLVGILNEMSEENRIIYKCNVNMIESVFSCT